MEVNKAAEKTEKEGGNWVEGVTGEEKEVETEGVEMEEGEKEEGMKEVHDDNKYHMYFHKLNS